jgi:predicted signal transduction protein with EAL and GGDEF domain
VLIEAARRTRAMLPAEAVLARLGGDEFAALVPFGAGVDAITHTERLAAGIGDAIALPVHSDEQTVVVTASIGLACCETDAECPLAEAIETLIHRADVAMYQAKKSGRSRHCWFEPAIEEDMLARNRLEQAIRAGVQNGEFRPYYEKQIDLATGAIAGLEMLARWHSPERGVVGPDVFVPVAEEIGVMPDLSEALIRQALADARDWAPHLTLAINISPVQLRDPWFAQRLLKLLLEARIAPSRLDIEITEDSLTENLAMVRSLVTSLRNQGVRISLDDFGHCASSLAHLRTLPFDRIKIDRNFIAGLGRSRDSSAVVEAISSLGRGMDLPITAEGIESPEILDELRKLGTFRGQGYIYGRPLSGDDLREELAQDSLLAVSTPPAPAALDSRAG